MCRGTTAMRIVLLSLLSLLIVSLPCPAQSYATRTAIIEEINRHPELGAHEIEVDARSGRIILNGTVAKETDRILIGEIARTQAGVDLVENRLMVASPNMVASSGALDDMKAALRREPGLKNYSVSITQENDKFILNGKAGTEREAELVEQTARRYAGPVPVVSNITAPPAPTDAEISTRVAQALHDDPEVNMNGIEYRVENGRVYFSGHKANHREIDRILTITLMVPGVKDVRSAVETGR